MVKTKMTTSSRAIIAIAEQPPKTSRLVWLEEEEENEEAVSRPSSSLEADTGGIYQRFRMVVMKEPSEDEVVVT